jgi:hypothetical protein
MKKQEGFWFRISDDERKAMNILREESINISGFLRKCLRNKAKELRNENMLG